MLRELRFIAGVPFGFLAELFARLAICVSGNQLDVDFNYIGRAREGAHALHKSRNAEAGACPGKD